MMTNEELCDTIDSLSGNDSNTLWRYLELRDLLDSIANQDGQEMPTKKEMSELCRKAREACSGIDYPAYRTSTIAEECYGAFVYLTKIPGLRLMVDKHIETLRNGIKNKLEELIKNFD